MKPAPPVTRILGELPVESQTVFYKIFVATLVIITLKTSTKVVYSGGFRKQFLFWGYPTKQHKRMNDNELKALISLLDDEDREVVEHVEQQIRQMGGQMIPFLESEWEGSFNPDLQKRIEEIIHDLQYESVLDRMRDWKNGGRYGPSGRALDCGNLSISRSVPRPS